MTEPNMVQPSELVSPTVEPVPPAAVTPPEPSPEEILNQKISEAVAKAVAEATVKETERSKREIQSAKDKAMAEVAAAQRRARFAESTMDATRTRIKELDPDIAKEMELAEYRAKEQNRQAMEQQEQAAQYQADIVQQFHSQMNQLITGLGVDPIDKRIDWADDAPDLLTAQRRIQDSVVKIQKENIQTMQSGFEKRLKDLEEKAKQANIEVNSVDTTVSPGIVAGSDDEFLKKFGAGELPFTKANKERYDKIQQSY